MTKYRIERDGKVFSYNRNRYLKQHIGSNGYWRVKYNNISINTHIIIAKEYLGERPEGYQVNHIDGNKLNNHYTNLEYVTQQENLDHALRTGLHACSYRPCILVSPEGIEYDVLNVAEFCRTHNLAQPNINKVLKGKRRHHKQWTGRYKND